MTVTAADLSMRIGARRLPVVLPSLRDARLHTAAVILSVHSIGITALGFRVSVPQILSAILTAAVVDVVLTLRLTGTLVWPASGMLTGSGVALILRVAEMQAGDYWTWSGWHLYALVAGASVLTKYVLRFRGAHLFNPSNVGLVGAFLILGSTVVEPLDFWWAPLDGWMLLAYAVIIGGGIAITARLRLLEMAVVFWAVLAAGLGVLAASGHCMTATWSPDPVCGARFWWVLVTSPEILVFQLFMITDPKTIPIGRAARNVFAAALALLATMLIAPHSLEFGAKVGLLASLVVLSPARGAFDRLFQGRATVTVPSARPVVAFARGAGIGAVLMVVATGIALAGAPARQPVRAAQPLAPAVDLEVDVSTLPPVVVGPGVDAVNADIDPAAVAVTLAENLLVEAAAVREGDGGLLAVAATGERLAEMQARVDDAISTGHRVVSTYDFDSLHLDVAETGGGQVSAALALEATGTEVVVTYDESGAEVSRTSRDFSSTFVLRRAGDDRWLIAAVDE